MPPLVIVGTHKDVVKNPADHELISTKLHAAFHHSIAWDFIVHNDQGEGVRGRTTLNFFPVDNTQGRRDPTMKYLMSKMEHKLESADYVNELKPLKWLQCIDQLTAKKVPELPLHEVITIARSCKIPRESVPEFLRFMNKVSSYCCLLVA